MLNYFEFNKFKFFALLRMRRGEYIKLFSSSFFTTLLNLDAPENSCNILKLTFVNSFRPLPAMISGIFSQT